MANIIMTKLIDNGNKLQDFTVFEYADIYIYLIFSLIN
jgi:hypothetical protein